MISNQNSTQAKHFPNNKSSKIQLSPSIIDIITKIKHINNIKKATVPVLDFKKILTEKYDQSLTTLGGYSSLIPEIGKTNDENYKFFGSIQLPSIAPI